MKELEPGKRKIAYFTMEIGLDPDMATYSGGLGILAGDTVRSAADVGLSMAVVTLLNERGNFTQVLDASGNQQEHPTEWDKTRFLEPLPARISVTLEKRPVVVQAWQYKVRGVNGDLVPVFFLDTNLPENGEYDRSLTSFLYGGDLRYRLCQEIVLGVGGVRMLEALGCERVNRYHMNEGHSAFLTVELLERAAGGESGRRTYGVEAVREKCIFTTHTPVPAGHDRFPADLVRRTLDSTVPFDLAELFIDGDEVNMTRIGLNLSRYVNGVARAHGEVSRQMFPGYPIHSITNGVHPATWAAPPFRKLFDRLIPGWRGDAFCLRYALGIPAGEVWEAHQQAKRRLINHVNEVSWAGMDYDTLTIGFARRSTHYKRPDLLFSDPARLREICRRAGAVQVVFAGKAHPQDLEGKALIRLIFSRMKELGDAVKAVYLEDYDMRQAGMVVAGSDLWLNTPLRPREASGTSGMKAAINGVPSLSVLDGWWLEGHVENVTGWSIGDCCQPAQNEERNRADAAELYRKLEELVIPMYYRDRDRWLEIMRRAIALNGSFFNTQRMIQEYVTRAYFG